MGSDKRPNRIFNDWRYCDFPSTQAIVYDENEQVNSLVDYRPWNPNTEAMVIAIAGEVRKGMLSGDSEAAYGIFFGPESPRNYECMLDRNAAQTREFAELRAATVAVDMAKQIWSALPKFNVIVLLTYSSYLVDSMDGLIWEWAKNDFKDSKRRPVTHAAAFQRLHKSILALESVGVTVQFWRSGMQYIAAAQTLANVALDERMLCETPREIAVGRTWARLDPLLEQFKNSWRRELLSRRDGKTIGQEVMSVDKSSG